MEQFLCLLHKAGPGKCSSNILGKLYSHWEWMWIVNTVYPSTLWKTMRMSQTWYAGVKNVACKCTTHNYNQVPNSIFTDQHHIQRCVTMIVIVSQLCHWWLTTPQLLVQQTPTLNTIPPKFFGHAINDRKLRHSSWKCNLCTHVQRQACAHNTDVADAKSTVTTSTHRRHFHMPHVLLLSLLLFFFTYITCWTLVYTWLKPGTLEVKMDCSTNCRRGWLLQSTCVVSYELLRCGSSKCRITVFSLYHLHLQAMKTTKAIAHKSFCWKQFFDFFSFWKSIRIVCLPHEQRH